MHSLRLVYETDWHFVAVVFVFERNIFPVFAECLCVSTNVHQKRFKCEKTSLQRFSLLLLLFCLLDAVKV